MRISWVVYVPGDITPDDVNIGYVQDEDACCVFEKHLLGLNEHFRGCVYVDAA